VSRRFPLGDREVDLDRATVRSPAGTVALTANEVRLLQVLVAHPGEAVDREQLLTEALGYRRAIPTRAIDQAIWRLRRKLEEDAQSPRYLQSDRHTGYRLVLQGPGPAPALLGRELELARLREMAQQVSEIWLVGLPGSGRSTLAAALQPQGTRLHIAAGMPPAPTPSLRLGLLSPELARELLQRAVLSVRGTLALEPGERAELPRLCAAVGGHPGSLVATALGSALAPLHELQPRFDPKVASWIQELPAELVRDGARLTVFPGPFTPADAAAVGVGAEQLGQVWRAGLCEGGGGVFHVEEVVRSALLQRGEPDAATWGRFVERVRRALAPIAARVGSTSQDQAISALLEGQPRLQAALRQAPDDPELQLAWALCGGTPLGPLPGPVQAVMHARAALTEEGPLSMESALSALDEELGRSPLPLLVSWRHRLVGRRLLREGRGAEAREELVSALSLLRSLEAVGTSREVAADLAEVALFLARPDEGLAWLEEALASPLLDTEREAGLRLLSGELALARGDLALWREQLEILELLGHRPVAVAVQRALLELLEGEPDRAAVRLLALEGVEERPSPRAPRLLALAWARLMQRRPSEASVVLGELARVCPPSDAAQLEALQLTQWWAQAMEGSIVDLPAVPAPERPVWAYLQAEPARIRAQGVGHPLLTLGWRLHERLGGS
jgi:hypothetical protein